MQHLSFTLMETLHLSALVPCLFSVALLIGLKRFAPIVIIPALFFLALSSSFLLGLQPVFGLQYSWQLAPLLWIESLQPALTFLLIIQLWRNRMPQGYYWAILALPVLGGSWLVIASLQLEEACISKFYCFDAADFRTLYQFFATALTFLLLTVHLGRLPIADMQIRRYQSHRYWLIIALISSFMALMVIDLFTLTKHISTQQHELIYTVLRISFLYLVMTSLFRVFEPNASATQTGAKLADGEMMQRIDALMRQQKLYRQMNVNREQCAQLFGMPEHVLSRSINQLLGKNFNEFINGYRVEEAKERLTSETTSVTAIAFEVGFSSIASFNRVFKALVGSSPTAFRKDNS